MYVDDLEKDFFDCVVTSRVLVLVNSDVDGGFYLYASVLFLAQSLGVFLAPLVHISSSIGRISSPLLWCISTPLFGFIFSPFLGYISSPFLRLIYKSLLQISSPFLIFVYSPLVRIYSPPQVSSNPFPMHIGFASVLLVALLTLIYSAVLQVSKWVKKLKSKLKLWQLKNLEMSKIQITKLLQLNNSFVKKLNNSNCHSSKTQIGTKLKFWQFSTQMVTKLNSNCDKL